jgi:hypothetical protein
MKRRTLGVTVTVVAFGLAIAATGCGGEGGEGAAPAEPAQPAPGALPAEPAEAAEAAEPAEPAPAETAVEYEVQLSASKLAPLTGSLYEVGRQGVGKVFGRNLKRGCRRGV